MNFIFAIFFTIFLAITVTFMLNNAEGFLSPLKQYESGTLAQNIVCSENLVLIYKSSDQSPRCVKEGTAMILENRGFTKEFAYSHTMTSDLKTVAERAASRDKCTREDFPIDWSGCDLYGRVLTNIDLRYANLEHANLFGVTLNDKNLTGVNLSYASLKKGNLDGSDFSNANLDNASLIDTKVRNAILVNATMKNAKLLRADFTGSNLTGSDMGFSTLTHANLSFVDLKDANIVGAGTWGTNLNQCFNHEICK